MTIHAIALLKPANFSMFPGCGVKSCLFASRALLFQSDFMFLDYFSAPMRFGPIVRQFVRREVLGRYRGSMLGVGWAFLTPLLMLGVYSFVFVGVFKARWPGAQDGGVAFALRLFAGLMVFNFFAEVLGRASVLVVEQPNLVKKVAFPLEVLPFVTLGSALFHLGLSLIVLWAGVAVFEPDFPLTACLAPLVVLPLLPLLLGLAWALSALGVFVRDIATMVGLGINLLLFLSPVFYSASTLSARWQFWMNLNPLTPVIENLRAVLFGLPPDWSAWSAWLLVSLVVAGLGAWIFGAMRHGFADVL